MHFQRFLSIASVTFFICLISFFAACKHDPEDVELTVKVTESEINNTVVENALVRLFLDTLRQDSGKVVKGLPVEKFTGADGTCNFKFDQALVVDIYIAKNGASKKSFAVLKPGDRKEVTIALH